MVLLLQPVAYDCAKSDRSILPVGRVNFVKTVEKLPHFMAAFRYMQLLHFLVLQGLLLDVIGVQNVVQRIH